MISKSGIIACVDGLKSFPTAINRVFPNVEMCSASGKLKYVSSKDVK
ncbi:MAG: hypothetical protein sL5_05330 [Candidatus Mesenet longicola]|uniref:Uncharacterized protein n=1 Tax=Candidatus Mesenet longicola TaxID=1892558 RepID=A0A8J3MP43_9RICK|nr:MAG: hypothetical protein sGL2_05680 [Candidatus Mesenet longicola]GHM59540.1 MAG: hypothetical protein sL5_05330 [Candidatus Mesenet longicola]